MFDRPASLRNSVEASRGIAYPAMLFADFRSNLTVFLNDIRRPGGNIKDIGGSFRNEGSLTIWDFRIFITIDNIYDINRKYLFDRNW